MFVTRPLLRQYVLVILVNLTILCVGMDMSWTSPVLVKLRDPAESPLSRPITEDESGWIVSIGYILSIFTLPWIGFLADHMGRKQCLLLASLPKIIAGVLTIFATEVWMLLVARAISLTIDTAVTTIVMIYSTEIASKEIRGALGSIISILSCVGVLLMLIIGPYISYLNLSILLTAITVCASIPLIFIPDTPYSLYNKGKLEEARTVLTLLRGSEALAEEDIKELSQSEPNKQFNKKEILKNKAYLKAMSIVVFISIGVQFNGFIFISFYLQTILEITSTSVSPTLGSLVIGVVQVLSSVSAGLISDRFGRKIIIIVTLLGMAVGLAGLAAFFAVKQQSSNVSGFLKYLPLVSIAIITWCHSGGVGSQYLVLTTELLDDRIRATGTSTSILSSTAALFFISRYTLTILSNLGPVISFVMFGVICCVLSLSVYVFVPETKKKTIADIQRALDGHKEAERKDYVTRF